MSTLNTTSLSNLAAALGSDGLKLAMCLNVPTTALVQIQFQGLDSGWNLDAMVSNMLFYWKLMRRTATDSEKVGSSLLDLCVLGGDYKLRLDCNSIAVRLPFGCSSTALQSVDDLL